MMGMYILDGHEAIPADQQTWMHWFKNAARQVANESIGEIQISTVFLGIDHRFGGDGPPLLFETMIFGGPHDQAQERCSTWEQAEVMHAKAVALVRESA